MGANRETDRMNLKEQLLNQLEQLKADKQKSVIFMAIDLRLLKGSAVVEQIDERNYLIEYKGFHYVVNIKGDFFVINKLD